MKTLLKKEAVLTPENQKTNILIPFEVKEDYEKLIIDYSYSPKELSDCECAKALTEENLLRDTDENRRFYPDYTEFLPLKNLVTLSLDSPEAYMGAAHRQADKQHHIISEDFSSVGFLKGRIIKGQWTLYLNVHALVTEECVCSITVQGGEADE